MSIPLTASPAPVVPEVVDLLTGPSKDFKGSIGSWAPTGTGTTTTYDAAVGVDANHGSVKLHTTADSGRYMQVSLPGTFKNGHIYEVVLAMKADTLTTTQEVQYEVDLGLLGTDNALGFMLFGGPDATGFGDAPSGEVSIFRLIWVPTADRTGVILRVGRYPAGSPATTDLWVLQARVAEVALAGTGLAFTGNQNAANGFSKFFLPSPNYILGLRSRNTAENYIGWSIGYGLTLVGPGEPITGDVTELDISGSGFYAYGRQSSAGRRMLEGFQDEAGPDYVGVWRGERSATEFEIYPADDYDVYLLDGADDAHAKHWWHEEADGAYKASAGRKSRIGLYFQQAFHVTGAQTTGTAKNEPAEYWQMPYPAEIDEVRIHLGTAPTGATFIVDVNINGTTIFTTQANRPTIAISGTDATSGAPDTTKFAKNDRLSFDTDQIGSTIAGSDLTVMVRGRYLW